MKKTENEKRRKKEKKRKEAKKAEKKYLYKYTLIMKLIINEL